MKKSTQRKHAATGRASAAQKSQAKKSNAPTITIGSQTFALTARPDPIDFRDQLYVPTLVEVPSEQPLETYLKSWKDIKVPVLDQGTEGACTGFGLAAVAHYLLCRREVHCDTTRVSARMFYEMARRYDEWDGEDYSGSSARGAMKGWHKHGVCSEDLWKYKSSNANGTLTPGRALNALNRPLGAYFRVNHRDLVSMHSAIAEVGILYATAMVHEGWGRVRENGLIQQSARVTGGHAFAIVGYDNNGFWLQNSWGDDWGKGGFAHVTYDDWLANGTDVWVARLGAPVISGTPQVGGLFAISTAGTTTDVGRAQLQSHTIAIGNDGKLRNTGEVGNTEEDVRRIFAPGGIFETSTSGWPKKRILLYAHGGLVSESAALQRVAENLGPMLKNHIFPLAFIWKTDLWSTLGNMLKDILRKRRPEGPLDVAKDFLLDRVDDSLEVLARLPGKAVWGEMKENAERSTSDPEGGARLVLQLLAELLKRDNQVEVHFCGHSAGSIFLGPIFREFCAPGSRRVPSLTLWAPACTMQFFEGHYLKALDQGKVDRFNLYTLTDAWEQDDHCAYVYNKSLLYLVSNACDERSGLLWRDGTPLLGMEKFLLHADHRDIFGLKKDAIKGNPDRVKLKFGTNSWWIRSPNNVPEGQKFASKSHKHGDFDDDKATRKSTLASILGTDQAPAPNGKELTFRPTNAGLKSRRHQLEKAMPISSAAGS